MKYLMKAMREQKIIYLGIIQTILTGIELFVGAQILLWITDVVNHYEDPLYYIEIILAGCILNIIINGILSYMHFIIPNRLYTNLHNMLTTKLASADYELFVKYSPGELISVSHGIFKLSKLVRLVLSMIVQIISIIINLYMICSIQIELLLPMGCIYSIGFIILYKINKIWARWDVEKESYSIKRDSKFDELVNGFAENRTFNTNPEKEVIQLNGRIYNILQRRSKLSIVLNNSIMTIDTIGMMAIILVGINLLKQGIVSEPVVVAMVMYAWRIIDPVITLVTQISDFSEYKAPLPKFNEVMNYTDKIKDGNINLVSFDKKISINDIGFSYNKSDLVLDGISFDINKGEKIGICGASGGGKSTLLKLIPRLYNVDSGSIMIDGINIEYLTKKSVKKYIGVVHQDTYIFNMSIMENIRFAKPNAMDNEVIEAAKKAYAYDFIISLPDGFNTNVGPKGLKLSGGQKQRIALARVFLSDPEIVLLDEATSALDVETEKLIQKSLDDLKGKTVIAVAHRLSTIKNFDKIVVIDQHKIAEIGDHDSLMAKSGIYANLWNKSIKEENVV